MDVKEVLISEEQLHDRDAIAKALFCDEKDPRSTAYVRLLRRPEIRWGRVALYLLLPALAAAALVLCLKQVQVSPGGRILAAAAFLLAYFLLTAKRAILCLIRIYQRLAPDSLRNKCRFEPSCSEYMILAIEKYGLIKGLRKGFGRFSRCNTKGGGFDYP